MINQQLTQVVLDEVESESLGARIADSATFLNRNVDLRTLCPPAGLRYDAGKTGWRIAAMLNFLTAVVVAVALAYGGFLVLNHYQKPVTTAYVGDGARI
jgi:hypothetical protein